VALGNWGSEQAIPVLSRALDDPSALVRAHAGWALGRVDSAAGTEVLGRRLDIENDSAVTAELRAALGGTTVS
jgi:epoxyqueuosine reductase